MPKNKDFKRLVRARMRKTGESYTTARAHLLRTAAGDGPQPLPDGYEKLAGMSDDAVSRATGLTWPEWAVVLDDADASAMEHRDIARLVMDVHELSGWWAQAVTVGYERLRGLRDPGQRRGGDYEVNKSKTMAVPVVDLWHAFHDDDLRGRWLPDLGLVIRSAEEPRLMRTVLTDDSRLEVRFTSKGAKKSTVSLQHRRLPDRETAADRRAFWGERLQALEELLLGD
ncbi:MAG: hypothetical protein P8170_06305 [Gemmatimonadota bacterium]